LLTEILDARLSPLETARLAQAAEHAFPGTPCGIMDMYASAAAKRDRALLIDCRSNEARHVPADFNSMGATLLVIDTGVKHDLATSAYAERRATCAAAARILGLPSLRSATIESLNMHGLSNDQRRRALHVIAENTRTILAAEALALSDLPRFGEVMFQSHASLRDLYEVSCAELDVLVAAAKSMREAGEGVHGARMTGGGFGGCAIVLCATSALDSVRNRLRDAFAARSARAPAMMFTTCAAGGARTLELGR
jgi:galactokinase